MVATWRASSGTAFRGPDSWGCSSRAFCIECIKTEQSAFEKRGMLLDMGQWLSIPFILAGGYMIWRSLARPAVTEAVWPEKTKSHGRRG